MEPCDSISSRAALKVYDIGVSFGVALWAISPRTDSSWYKRCRYARGGWEAAAAAYWSVPAKQYHVRCCPHRRRRGGSRESEYGHLGAAPEGISCL